MTGITVTASPSVHCHLTKHHHQHTTQWLIHLTTSATLRLPFNSDDHEQTANILSLFLGLLPPRAWGTTMTGHDSDATMEHDDGRARRCDNGRAQIDDGTRWQKGKWGSVKFGAGLETHLVFFFSHSTNFYWLWNRLMSMPKWMVQLSLPWHIHFCILYVRKFSDNFMIR